MHKTVLSAFHDLNLAAMYSDVIYVVKDGQIYSRGTPREVLTERMIEEVYGVRAKVRTDEDGQLLIIYQGKIKREGPALEVFLKAGPLACIFSGQLRGRINLFGSRAGKECMKIPQKDLQRLGYGFMNRNSNDETSPRRGETDESRTVHKYNAEQWDQWVEDGIEWGIRSPTRTIWRPKNGTWDVIISRRRCARCHTAGFQRSGGAAFGVGQRRRHSRCRFVALWAQIVRCLTIQKAAGSERMVAER